MRDRLMTGVVRGRDARNGMPRQVEVTSDEMLEALEESSVYICRAVQNVLEETPPELVGDLYERGMVLTGGSAMLYGMDKLIANYTGLKVNLLDDPTHSVVKGAAVALKKRELLKNVDYQMRSVKELIIEE